MTGEKGMQYTKKTFTIYKDGFKIAQDFKKCFKDDCKHEDISCEFCTMIQGKFIYYQPKQ